MASITIQTIRTKAAALDKAEAKTGNSNAERQAATRDLFSTVASFFATDRTTPVDAVLPAIYGAKWAEFKKTVQKSRKTEWNTLREVAMRDGALCDAVAAMVAGLEREFKPTFLKAMVIAKNDLLATAATIKAALEAKPAKVEPNTGDAWEGLMVSLATVFKTAPDTFKPNQAHFAGLQAFYNSQRGVGHLRTTRELAKPKQPDGVIDFAAAK